MHNVEISHLACLKYFVELVYKLINQLCRIGIKYLILEYNSTDW